MAKKKKRRLVDTQDIKYFIEDTKEVKPSCYGHKQAYCDASVCGKWFESCTPSN